MREVEGPNGGENTVSNDSQVNPSERNLEQTKEKVEIETVLSTMRPHQDNREAYACLGNGDGHGQLTLGSSASNLVEIV